MAARTRAQAQTGKGREIAGICLLGFGVFCALSLVSMHAGSGTMMGPGGHATASGLYALAGVASYFMVAALLVVAVRVFRGRSMTRNLGEIIGVTGLFSAGTILLHLPFAPPADRAADVAAAAAISGEELLHGPGGMVGEWLGGLLASFVGTVGAVMVASLVALIAVLILTNISVGEVGDVMLGAVARVLVAVSSTGRGLGKIVVAMFPRRHDQELIEATNPFEDEDYDEEAREPLALNELDDTIAEDLPSLRGGFDRTIRGMPSPSVRAPLRADDSDAVRVGRARPMLVEADSDELQRQLAGRFEPGFDGEDFHDLREDFDLPRARPMRQQQRIEPRRALSAVVAEVAAVECAAEAAAVRPAEPTAALMPISLPRAPEVPIGAAGLAPLGAPVIVKPVDRATARVLPSVATPMAPPIIAPPKKEKDDGPGFIRLSEGEFQLPTAELLEYVPPTSQEIDKKALYDMAARLEQAMSNYGVKGSVSAINMGPVVTMYEFAPAPGTRTGKIVQLENDLAMALEAQAVRIVAPIPGKAVVGVEVPNKVRQTVYLKEILSDDTFRGAGSKLQIALGKDIQGNPVTVNLAKMPHLLVAGTTGSGKSVTVNGMITSILYNATPEEVRFIMVDPKMLELSIYEGIPHLLLPVVTDPKKANLALRWAVDEMERRYELLSKTGVRDIASYNAKIDLEEKKKSVAKAVIEAAGKAGKKLRVVLEGPGGEQQELPLGHEDPTSPGVVTMEMLEAESAAAAAAQAAAENPDGEKAKEKARKLPFIVIVIDEFADLMMVAPKDVETSVARLAQKARAAGLHVILATQRPSVDVITGLIKANFPSRIALQVAGKMDSRVILDQHGAESLLGNGDMLFSDRGTKLRRIHGAFLSDDEVHRVVDCLKQQAKPVYDMDILKPREDEEGEGGAPVDDFQDALYDQAVAIVCETRQASVSFIQRRLQIGYNRSARMVEKMERDGIVGPANGIKPREVIAPSGDYLTNAV
jgi:S-DNA-T family DNA segregation ATPase FtsK/SpoIIIE